MRITSMGNGDDLNAFLESNSPLNDSYVGNCYAGLFLCILRTYTLILTTGAVSLRT